jgi:hypothetical protein
MFASKSLYLFVKMIGTKCWAIFQQECDFLQQYILSNLKMNAYPVTLKNDATLFLTIIFHCCYLPCNMLVMSHCFENKIEIHMFNMPSGRTQHVYYHGLVRCDRFISAYNSHSLCQPYAERRPGFSVA